MTQARPSRAQVGSILFALASVIYVLGFLLEVTAADLGSVLTAVKVEYFGELFLVIGFTWFFAEFCRIALPKIIYWFESAFSVFSMYLLFTTEELDAVRAIWNSMRFCADTGSGCRSGMPFLTCGQSS